MVDTLTRAERSALMARIKRQDTAPEMIVRRKARALGLWYRLHRRDLPGTPDLVFACHRAVFVHGCFWHGHKGCRRGRLPVSRQEYWKGRIKKNQARDRSVLNELERRGWTTLVIWECQAKDDARLRDLLVEFLKSPAPLKKGQQN